MHSWMSDFFFFFLYFFFFTFAKWKGHFKTSPQICLFPWNIPDIRFPQELVGCVYGFNPPICPRSLCVHELQYSKSFEHSFCQLLLVDNKDSQWSLCSNMRTFRACQIPLYLYLLHVLEILNLKTSVEYLYTLSP